MKRKTRWLMYGLILLGWCVLQYFNTHHYSEDSWITDQWLIWGLFLIIIFLAGFYQLERLKAKAIKLIWLGGSCTIDTGNPFCRIASIKNAKGKILCPEY